jgi:localization factor PodJL
MLVMTSSDPTDVRGRFDRVGRQLEQLARLGIAQPSSLRSHPRDPEPQGGDVLSRLDRELDRVGAAPRSDGPVASDELAAARSVDAPSITPEPTSALDRALMEIAERQRALEAGDGPTASRASRPDVLPRAPTQDLSRLEDQLRQITTQFEGLRPCGLDNAVETLRNDLAEIGLMVKEAMPRQAIEALENEVRALSERLHHSHPSGVTDAAIAGVERELGEIRKELRGLRPAENMVGVDQALDTLSQKIDQIATDANGTAAFEQLESTIAALRGIATHAASEGALGRLSDDMRELAAKVDQIAISTGNDGGLLSTLERRIASIADALETRNIAGGPLPLDLDAVVKGLADKLEGVGVAHSDPAVVGQLEDRIGRLIDKLEMSSVSSLPLDLDAVVKGLADKLEGVGFAHSDQAVVGRLDDRIGRLIDKLDTSSGGLDHLERVERGLNDLLASFDQQRSTQETRAAAETGDVIELRREMQQTQSSLQAVQGSLVRLLDRMATIEADVRAGAASAQIPPPIAPSVALAPRFAAATEEPRPAPPAAAERRPIDPNLPPDHPLEPGAVRARTASSPGERIAASEAALGGVKPATAPEPDGKTSFITAARRAAQAASSESATRADARIRASEKPAVQTRRQAGRWRERVRKFLVAASVAAIVLGSLHYVASLFSGPDEPTGVPQVSSPPPQDAPNAAPDAGATGGSDMGREPLRDPPPNRSELAPPTATPQRQSLLIPMGDGSSLSFPGSGAPTRVAGRSDRTPTTDVAAPRGDSVHVAIDSDSDTTGTVPAAATPSATETFQPSGTDKLPATIGPALRSAAAKGDPAAEYEIAQRYAEGRGMAQSFTEAAAWFERAAKQGSVPAQFRLGGLYEKGLGVAKDLNAARRLYLPAAEAGNAKAMHNLAVLYAEGIDGKPDYATAAKWFRKGADHGLPDSQYNLGVLYARGIGVEAKLGEAYKWFALAAHDGDPDAIAKRDDVGGRLDPAALAAAKAAAQAFAAEPQPDAAVQPAAPPGGWDAAAAAAPPARPKRNTAPKPEASSPPLAIH